MDQQFFSFDTKNTTVDTIERFFYVADVLVRKCASFGGLWEFGFSNDKITDVLAFLQYGETQHLTYISIDAVVVKPEADLSQKLECFSTVCP